MSSIEEAFTNEMLAIYEKSGRSVGYWPSRFLQKVRRSGGVASAKYWLSKPGVSEGFKRLAKEGRLELAMEALILRPEYEELFSEQDRAVARRRLAEYGVFGGEGHGPWTSLHPVFHALWIRDGEWECCVHGPHVNRPLGKRHVHVRRIRKRKGEYSWNVDGSRHDAHKFPANEEGISRARAIAARRLRVDEKTLQFVVSFEGIGCELQLFDLANGKRRQSAVVKTSSPGVVLANEDWLMVVELSTLKETGEQGDTTPATL